MSHSFLDALRSAERVCLFGYGKSNDAVLRYLKKNFPKLKITLRSDSEISKEEAARLPLDGIIFGEGCRDGINETVLFLSPTVRRDSDKLRQAFSRGVIPCSDIELFLELYRGECFGVTGSDGKSTTTYLTASMLSDSEHTALPLGNFGKSPLDALGKDAIPVLELSSFQLMNFTPRLRRACITNISRNHLNWHKDFSEYINAKSNILKYAEETVFDYDSKILRELMAKERAYCVCSLEKSHGEIKSSLACEHTLTYKDGKILLDGEEYVSALSAERTEEYNLRNYMLSVGMTLGISTSERQAAVINGFLGLPHRCELVRVHEGVRYINSSIDTSAKRTENTIRSISGELTLILCGRAKSNEIEELCSLIEKRVKRVIVFGECSELYERSLRSPKPIRVSDMESATAKAKAITQKGGTVLLSPSCTSFDIYKNFEERGEDFRKCVLNL